MNKNEKKIVSFLANEENIKLNKIQAAIAKIGNDNAAFFKESKTEIEDYVTIQYDTNDIAKLIISKDGLPDDVSQELYSAVNLYNQE